MKFNLFRKLHPRTSRQRRRFHHPSRVYLTPSELFGNPLRIVFSIIEIFPVKVNFSSFLYMGASSGFSCLGQSPAGATIGPPRGVIGCILGNFDGLIQLITVRI